MAESNNARWPALSRLVGIAVLATTLLIPAAPATAAPATAAPATAAPASRAAAGDGVILTIAPLGKGILNPGQDLVVSGTVRNATSATIAGGTLQLSITDDEIDTRDALAKWLGPDAAGEPERTLLTLPLKTQLLPGQEVAVNLAVPAASVGLPKNEWGTRGLEATFTVAGGSTVSGRSAVVWSGAPRSANNRLGLVVPITVPPGTKGLIPADDLAAYTSPGGTLSSQLDGVLGRPVIIAIDPMVIASIRVLGSSAPPSAQQWLDALSHANNDIFPLSYADSDIALESEAKTGQILTPTTFQQAIDPTHFAPSPTLPPGKTSAPVSPRATPAPAPDLPKDPADVLAWNYTATDIAWPAAGSVTPHAMNFFASSGLTTTIISDSELTAEQVAAPAATVGKHAVLVSDEALSTAIRRAAVASSDIVWRQAVAEAQAQLAILAQSGSGTTVLGSLDRETSRSATRLAATVDALISPSATPAASLSLVRSAGTKPEVALAAAPTATGRDEQVTALLSRGTEISAFATALTHPAELTGEYRLDLLALLATSWRGQPDEWQQAVADSLKASQKTLQAVTITTEGPFLIVASQTDIPITLSNDLDQAVTVRVRLVPSNGRLLVDQETEATIDARSAKSVLVPVTAKVGNGSVMLHISVHSPTGVTIADPKTVAVSVQAEWEGIGAVIFGILVVLFFGFGVWRNIARRRRERSTPKTDVPEQLS